MASGGLAEEIARLRAVDDRLAERVELRSRGDPPASRSRFGLAEDHVASVGELIGEGIVPLGPGRDYEWLVKTLQNRCPSDPGDERSRDRGQGQHGQQQMVNPVPQKVRAALQNGVQQDQSGTG